MTIRTCALSTPIALALLLTGCGIAETETEGVVREDRTATEDLAAEAEALVAGPPGPVDAATMADFFGFADRSRPARHESRSGHHVRTSALDHIEECDDVGALTGGLAQGLTLAHGDVDAGEGTFSCNWNTGAGGSITEIRTLTVTGTAQDQTGLMATKEFLASTRIAVPVDHHTIEAAGGIAYAAVDESQEVLARVQVPDAVITVTGGGWATEQLDDATAVAIAARILGLADARDGATDPAADGEG